MDLILQSIFLLRRRGRQKKPKPKLKKLAQVVSKLLAPLFFSTAFNCVRYKNLSRTVESCRFILSDFLFYAVKVSGNKKIGILMKKTGVLYYNSRAPPSSDQFLKKVRM